jgi:hypothetical protein
MAYLSSQLVCSPTRESSVVTYEFVPSRLESGNNRPLLAFI